MRQKKNIIMEIWPELQRSVLGIRLRDSSDPDVLYTDLYWHVIGLSETNWETVQDSFVKAISLGMNFKHIQRQLDIDGYDVWLNTIVDHYADGKEKSSDNPEGVRETWHNWPTAINA